MDTITVWQQSLEELFARLASRKEGLSQEEAALRIKQYGLNTLKPPKRGKGITLFLSQFKSPLIILLMGAATMSMFLGGDSDAIIIMSIVVLSGLLGFFQERGALNALEKLLRLVENKIIVLRLGNEKEIPIDQIVPGDIVLLRAGDLVPADCRIIEAKHFFVDEATMTGESCPVEKTPEGSAEKKSILKQPNGLFLGTMVASGFAKAIVVATGQNTEFSKISDRVRFKPPETAFEVGVRKFGFFLLQVTMVLVITIFALNIYFKKPFTESLLFSLALAVGLTPQLLPVIISVNLSHGARRMAKKKVIVKRLASIENFGQMDVLCTDKTGTLTIGKTIFESAVDVDSNVSEKVAFYGYLNAHFQAGYSNPLDQAIVEHKEYPISDFEKVDEIPYDFIRKRLSILLQNKGKKLLIVKGAFAQVIAICNRIEMPDQTIIPLDGYKSKVEKHFEEQSAKGIRTLAVAYGDSDKEENLVFLGLLFFTDPLKPSITSAIENLKKKGVQLKIITGDNRLISMHVAECLGLSKDSIITGSELQEISSGALIEVVRTKNIFAEIEPNQKEKIVLALRKGGFVVGYIGDGVNDVAALHSADVSIAVDKGADAAKEAADIVLLEEDLEVLNAGVDEGRRTFINTMKYVYMATSANFGNMFSMAGASLFLPFFPLLAKQILLTNFLSDLPQTALATDTVDPDAIERPVKWDLPYIRRFMMVFGLLNSCADYLTFGVLLFWLKADQVLFQSAWFVENVVSAALIVFVIRTKKPFWESRPGRLLFCAIVVVSIGVPFLPLTSFGKLFGFGPIPSIFYAYLSGIIIFYITAAEITKKFFFRKLHNHIHG